MIASHETPDYKGGGRGGFAKPIPPRKLGDIEYIKLKELLPMYETSLKKLWQNCDSSEIGNKKMKSPFQKQIVP